MLPVAFALRLCQVGCLAFMSPATTNQSPLDSNVSMSKSAGVSFCFGLLYIADMRIVCGPVDISIEVAVDYSFED